MQQLAHFAEDVAENSSIPDFTERQLDTSSDLRSSLASAARLVREAHERHAGLAQNNELQGHSGLVANLDLTLRQERYQAEEIETWLKGL